MKTERKRKILVLGIDGMDQRITKRLLDEGKLPNIKKYLENGSAREDVSMLGAVPTITPPCWTTLATGAYPGTHGITCYWRQSPESLDAVVYNMDSRFCEAEQIWNVTSEAGIKTLVWHWPGSSWPPSSNSPFLHVVDGTQPGSVNMGIAQMDWEKIVIASTKITKLDYLPRVEKPAGVGCIIDDVEALVPGKSDDEMMELWWGDEARKGNEIRTYVHGFEDSELVIGSKVGYDVVSSPIKKAEKWANAPDDALEFTLLLSGGIQRRVGLILKDESGIYTTVKIYRNKKSENPLVTLKTGEMISGVIDEAAKNGRTCLCNRSYKLIELAEDGSSLKLWVSNALDVSNNTLWSPPSLMAQVRNSTGSPPPVSLIGGEDETLVREVFLPSWEIYNKWQADSLKHLIEANGYEAVFTHLHNVDCAGHQFWHLAKNLSEWRHVDEKTYQDFIEQVYIQTDKYLGEFLPYLDDGWSIFIVSDHGLVVGENIPPDIGEYGGLNLGVMKELGYTVLKKDESGNEIDEVDWEKTKAVQIRSNYIYINLKGRDKYGIVDPEDKYELEGKIISDLYGYCDKMTGERVIGLAVRNRDSVIFGLGGKECGDIFFTIDEGYNRLHGDGLTTARGYFGTSTTPVFISAGDGLKKNFATKRVIRQVDVAPTISALLGVRVPHECEGAPVYQILEEAEE
ncbi:MAG: alkaline phosphatase family protein [Synergistaceae bacterium]|nr:alkaline phosphatase family protein [Synergistaceae bacterium]